MENSVVIKKLLIDNIPALIWGAESEKIYIFVHGKMGCKESAKNFAEIAVSKGYQVISFDLPEHGERKDEDYTIMVWNAVKDLKCINKYVTKKWKEINIYACSLGSYFSLLSYKDINVNKCLFQCPVLNMDELIRNMMKWFDITEEQLQVEKEIPTPMGETLNWDYWMYVKENPIDYWNFKTYILYPSGDILTNRKIVDNFANISEIDLTVLEGAEHYFTESKYLEQLDNWIETNV